MLKFYANFSRFWVNSALEVRRVRSLVGGGILAAMGVALQTMVIVVSPLLQIGFSFLAMACSGYLYGPLVAGLSAVVVDIVAYMLRTTGPFFPGFTLNAFLTGFIYGLWLYRRPVRLWRCFGAVLCVAVVISLALTPLWLYILYGQGYGVHLVQRLIKNAVMLPVGTAMLYAVLRVVEKYRTQLGLGIKP